MAFCPRQLTSPPQGPNNGHLKQPFYLLFLLQIAAGCGKGSLAEQWCSSCASAFRMFMCACIHTTHVCILVYFPGIWCAPLNVSGGPALFSHLLLTDVNMCTTLVQCICVLNIHVRPMHTQIWTPCLWHACRMHICKVTPFVHVTTYIMLQACMSYAYWRVFILQFGAQVLSDSLGSFFGDAAPV
jgi:hypothetical protein